MRILLTNDDGVNATGLKILETIARGFSNDVWVVAPTDEQSGAGHSLTITRPVRLRKLGDRRSRHGTPRRGHDGHRHVIKDDPQDIICRSETRRQSCEDVPFRHLPAAMEGALRNPLVALSQVYVGKEWAIPAFAAAGMGDKCCADRPTPMAPRTMVNSTPRLAAGEVRGGASSSRARDMAG